MNEFSTTIAVRHQPSGEIYLVDVKITEFIGHNGDRYYTAYDANKNCYHKSSDYYNDFGQPETIWIKRSVILV